MYQNGDNTKFHLISSIRLILIKIVSISELLIDSFKMYIQQQHQQQQKREKKTIFIETKKFFLNNFIDFEIHFFFNNNNNNVRILRSKCCCCFNEQLSSRILSLGKQQQQLNYVLRQANREESLVFLTLLFSF